MTEPLESRVLLAASFAAGKLTVIGTGANDTIALNLVNDRVAVFEGGVQTSSFKGVKSIAVSTGDGRDRVTIDAKITVATRLDGGGSADTLTGGSGPDVLLGAGGHDYLAGGAGIDALLGGNNDDTLDGGLGDDYLEGAAGNDTVTYANRTRGVVAELAWDEDRFGEVEIPPYARGNGGEVGESDRYYAVDTLIATQFDDKLIASKNAYDTNAYTFFIDALAGNDSLDSSSGPHVNNGSFSPTLNGGDGDDTFGFGAYVHEAYLYGQAGNDTLNVVGPSSEGITLFDGGEGYDTQIIDAGGDEVDSHKYAKDIAPGIEEVIYRHNESGIFRLTDSDNTVKIRTEHALTIYAQGGNDRLTLVREPVNLGRGRDTIYGGEGNDVLFGGEGNDVLFGEAGNDALFGGAGDDSLDGGLGDDYLEGQAGVDTLIGGDGNDTFHTRDRAKDLIYGGAGTDKATRDTAEAVVDSIETA